MLSRLKTSITRSNALRQRNILLKKIESALFNEKGFYLKELYLSEDFQSAIAIDRTYQALNLILIENNEIRTCMVRKADIIEAELLQNGQVVEKVSRQFIDHSKLEAQGDETWYPPIGFQLKLHTKKRCYENFNISILPHQSKKAKEKDKCRATHWFEICKHLIEKADNKMQEKLYQCSMNSAEVKFS